MDVLFYLKKRREVISGVNVYPVHLAVKYVHLDHLDTIPNLNLRISEDTQSSVTNRALEWSLYNTYSLTALMTSNTWQASILSRQQSCSLIPLLEVRSKWSLEQDLESALQLKENISGVS